MVAGEDGGADGFHVGLLAHFAKLRRPASGANEGIGIQKKFAEGVWENDRAHIAPLSHQ